MIESRKSNYLDLINNPRAISLLAFVISAIVAGPGSWLFKNYYNDRKDFEQSTEKRLHDLETLFEASKAGNLESFVTLQDYIQDSSRILNRINTLEKRQYELNAR